MAGNCWKWLKMAGKCNDNDDDNDNANDNNDDAHGFFLCHTLSAEIRL